MNFAFWDILIFLCSLCGIYPRGRLVCIKNTKRFFLVFLLSVEALLEQILMNFDLGHLTFFSLSLFSLCGIYPREGLPNKITKRFILVFLLSVGALLEQILMSYDFGHFTFFLIFFLLSVKSEIYLRGKSVSVNTKQKKVFLSLSSLCGSSP